MNTLTTEDAIKADDSAAVGAEAATSPAGTTPDAAAVPEPLERTFRTFDGADLFYRAWLPAGLRAARAVILVHRGHEHSGRWTEMVAALMSPTSPDTPAVFAWDARGHGRSPGERGWGPDLSAFVRDMDEFVRHVSAEHGIAVSDMAVVAHSVGAVVAAAWLHDYAPPVRSIVLACPALDVRLYVPLALPSLRALNALRKKAFVKSYVKAGMLTHDPAQAQAYRDDPLISKQIAVNILVDLYDAAARLTKDAGAVVTPALVLGAGSDWVVKNSAIKRFHDRLGSADKELEIYPGMGHAIFHEAGRERVFARVRGFLDRHFAAPANREERVERAVAFTRREHERLAAPGPWYCPRRAALALTRAWMKTAGRLSAGIRLGWRTGFDSGQSLDAVYRNRPSGLTPIGKLVDYFFLNAVGWRGIRQRKLHLDELLTKAVAERARANAAVDAPARVHIVDIASGPGRYVLEFLARHAGRVASAAPGAAVDLTATLRDRAEGALEEGRALARQLDLPNARHEAGDAFCYAELAALDPKPDVAIVSGLYELFEDNALVLDSLRGLAAAMPPGGCLVYTNQPWHPQIEFIARVLDNRDGRRWVMRRRTQLEMDDLVRRAGFEKSEMRVDKWGIFTVSLARRA